MTIFNAWPGKNDHIHGDENTRAQTSDDVIEIIATNAPYAHDWIKRLQKTDAFYHFAVIVCQNQDNPAFASLIESLKDEIDYIIR
jgi:hypothetical protein